MTNPEPEPSSTVTDTTLASTADATPATESGGRSARTAGSAPTTVTVSRVALSKRSAAITPVAAPIAPAINAMPAAAIINRPSRGPAASSWCPSRTHRSALAEDAKAGPARAHGSGVGWGGRDQPVPGVTSSPLINPFSPVRPA
jgi:hypothetical protein